MGMLQRFESRLEQAVSGAFAKAFRSAVQTDELVEMLREHAEEQHYVFTGPVVIDFTQEPDLVTGRFRVRSQATAQVTPNASRGRPAPSGRAKASIEVNG